MNYKYKKKIKTLIIQYNKISNNNLPKELKKGHVHVY